MEEDKGTWSFGKRFSAREVRCIILHSNIIVEYPNYPFLISIRSTQWSLLTTHFEWAAFTIRRTISRSLKLTYREAIVITDPRHREHQISQDEYSVSVVCCHNGRWLSAWECDSRKNILGRPFPEWPIGVTISACTLWKRFLASNDRLKSSLSWFKSEI